MAACRSIRGDKRNTHLEGEYGNHNPIIASLLIFADAAVESDFEDGVTDELFLFTIFQIGLALSIVIVSSCCIDIRSVFDQQSNNLFTITK